MKNVNVHAVLALALGLLVTLVVRSGYSADPHELAKSLIALAESNAFTTLSGLLAVFAVLALVARRVTLAGIALTIAGAAGLGVFWDRWTREAGHHVHIRTLFTGTWPSVDQVEVLVTHLPLLIAGIAIIAIKLRKTGRETDTSAQA